MDKMKRIFWLLCLTLLCGTVQAQQLQGAWSGKLDLGSLKLGIIFTFHQQEGKPACTIEVPMQSLKGYRLQVVKITEHEVELKSASLGASFKGEIVDPALIRGIWSQSGQDLPLELRPGKGHQVNRPQEPVGPFDYQTKEVAFHNQKEDVWLGGTLTFPVDYTPDKKYPVVLMVSGSGQQNRDEELFSHKPFAVLADFLAKKGIASLRYDDRGVGRSTGDPRPCTTEHFTEDAKAGLRLLKERYDFEKIGVIGHSEGGLIAFRLAADDEADFIVSLAGPGIKGDTLTTEQVNEMNRLSGKPASLNIAQVTAMLEPQLKLPWMKWFFEHDPSATMSSVKVPVMAVNGSKDVQVLAKSNLQAIRRLIGGKNPKNLVKEYEGLNHLFQHCQTGLPTEYFEIEETFSPEVMNDIAHWILAL